MLRLWRGVCVQQDQRCLSVQSRSDSIVSKVEEMADPEVSAIATHAADSQAKMNQAEWTWLSQLIQQRTVS